MHCRPFFVSAVVVACVAACASVAGQLPSNTLHLGESTATPNPVVHRDYIVPPPPKRREPPAERQKPPPPVRERRRPSFSPSLVLNPVDELAPTMSAPKGLAFDAQDRLYVAGRIGVKVFNPDGKLAATLKTDLPAQCVAVAPDGRVYVGLKTRIVVFGPDGRQIASWGKNGRGPGQFLDLTAIAVSGDNLYVADAGNRCIHRFAANGDYVYDLREFNLPSPYFDCAAAPNGTLYVAHTGKHRVEHYDANLRPLGEWGEFGSGPAETSDRCNPTNIALLDHGRTATTEQGAPRLKVYDAKGRLLAVAGPEGFPRKAEGMDLAVDSTGRIALLEPVSGKVRFYVLAYPTAN